MPDFGQHIVYITSRAPNQLKGTTMDGFNGVSKLQQPILWPVVAYHLLTQDHNYKRLESTYVCVCLCVCVFAFPVQTGGPITAKLAGKLKG